MRCPPTYFVQRAALAACLILAGSASGHGFNPSLLQLTEFPGGKVAVLWKSAGSVDAKGLIPKLPAQCREISPRASIASGADQVERWMLDCGPQGLLGAQVAMDGFELIGEDALVRVTLIDGRTLSTVLRADSPSWTVPEPGSRVATLASYLALGIKHILLGYDHLLFVLGLILLVGLRRRLLVTITAFTVAHSITLSLATLNLVHLPARAAEAVIALSIVFLAVELARQREQVTWAWRHPWAVAFAFGLLHGFGFAGALAEIGLPQGEIPLALLGFNVGVEIGQLLFVAAAIGTLAFARRLRPQWPNWIRVAVVYSIGSLASWWCFERVAAFWT